MLHFANIKKMLFLSPPPLSVLPRACKQGKRIYVTADVYRALTFLGFVNPRKELFFLFREHLSPYFTVARARAKIPPALSTAQPRRVAPICFPPRSNPAAHTQAMGRGQKIFWGSSKLPIFFAFLRPQICERRENLAGYVCEVTSFLSVVRRIEG